MKYNQKGFSAVEIVVVIVVIGLLGTVGWLVYDRQSNSKVEPKATNSEAQKQNATTNTTAESDDVYLSIKEWGIKFKLNDNAKGSYYKLRQEGQYTYADVFNSNFGAMKNKNGVQCKDEKLFVVARYSENDPRLNDSTNSKPASYMEGFGYTGTAAHQMPPSCSLVNEDPHAGAEYDEAVLEAFTKYKMALAESFKSLQAI